MTNREIAALCAKEVHTARLAKQMTTATFTLRDATDMIAGVLDRVGFKARAPRKPSTSKMTDEEWIAYLEKEPSLAGVDIRREIGKAQFWARENHRQPTRRFLVNWLNNADRTLTVSAIGQSSRQVVNPDPYVEPKDWRPVAAKLYPETDYFTGRAWGDVAVDYRKAIVKEML